VKWHPSCQLLAAASAQQITVFEVSGPASLFKFEFKQATAMEFSPTGYLLAAANADTLTVWDTNTGSVLFRFDTFSRIVSLAWSHPSSSGLGDGGLKSVLQQSGTGHPVLISIDESGKLRLWDRLFVNKASVSELSFGQAPRPLHMHITPRNLLVMVGAKQSSDLSTLDCIRTLGSADA
jgi:WD40 repeat protein